jgi:C-terminal peptidase prc
LLSVLFLTPAYAGTIVIQNSAKKDLPQYFRDVTAKAKLNIAIDSAVKRGILKTGSFFRPNENVPAIMFLETILLDAGFKPEKSENSFPEEALKRKLINSKEFAGFQSFENITKLQVIKAIIKTKGLLPPRRISQKFREIFKFLEQTDSEKLPYIETAYASGIISIGDLNYFNPDDLVSREEFITWIYNYFDHGKRQSKVEADKSFRWNKRAFRGHTGINLKSKFKNRGFGIKKETQKNTTGEKNLGNNLTIRVLNKEDVKNISLQQNINLFPGKDVLDEVYNDILSRYRFIGDLDKEKRQDMIDASLTALVKEIGDKYSRYVKPAKSENFMEQINGEFEGIGAYVEMVDSRFTIMSPIAGSPAEKYGLISGDIVTHVDDVNIEGKTITEIVNLIMGPANTEVKLKILRDKISRDFKIIREKIVEPVVTLEWEKSVPVIEIHQFNYNTINVLNEKIAEVMEKENKGIVLDLRNNPGGHLQSAIDVSSVFLKKGEMIFYMEERTKEVPFVAKKDGILSGLDNIVILQNGGSASASEILIGALKDHNRAKIVGTKSLGKGTVQNVIDLQNGGLLKLTVAKWLTPKRTWIHEIGISPDLEVAIPTQEEREKNIDKQLEAAVREVLNK